MLRYRGTTHHDAKEQDSMPQDDILPKKASFLKIPTVRPTERRRCLSTNWYRYLVYLRDSPIYPAMSFIAVILFWQFIVVPGHIPFISTKYLGSPEGIWHSFVDLMKNGYEGTPLWVEVTASLSRVLFGFVLGAAVAMPIGLLMGYNKFINRLFGPTFSFLRPVPALAFIPIILIWFGIGNTGRIVLIAATSFLYVVLATSTGVASIPKAYLRAAENYQLSTLRTIYSIILPATLPSILIGFRTGMALSWAVVVAAELIAAQHGLGFMIQDAGTFFRINVVYVGVILIGLIGVSLDAAFNLAHRIFLHWLGK